MNKQWDAQEAFNAAIEQGKLTTKRGSFEYAGNWMFIGQKDQGDEFPEVLLAFKHRDTREYMHVAI